MNSRTLGRRWIAVIGALLLAGCGGDGGDEVPASRGIAGTWTFPCNAYGGGEWRAETLRFEEESGILLHAGMRHGTPDCSDPGVTLVAEQGTYSLGRTLECANGAGARCTELDIAWDSGTHSYGVYSVDEAPDPDRLLLSGLKEDPAMRPLDVDPDHDIRRVAFPDKVGHAFLDIYLSDGGWNGTPSPPAAGYVLLPYDLNHGSGGHYIWLYYKMGRANGADGTPIGAIYTVNQGDGERPVHGGTGLPVNLNAGPIVGHELWLYTLPATRTVMRCIALANPTDGSGLHAPPETAGVYPIHWVEELIPDSLKTPFPSYPPDVQDLNEGEGAWTDYLYIGYGAD
jgi:hypothetical protein